MSQIRTTAISSAGEVIKINAAVYLTVSSAHGGTHCVDTEFTVGVGVDYLARELD